MAANPLFELQDSEREVLRTIWNSGPVARIEIGHRTGLGSASVTRIARDLIDRGLVEESVLRTGGRGQPTRPMVLRSDGAFALGVYFSHTYMDVGLLDLAGNLVGRKRISFKKATPTLIANAASTGLERLTAAAGIDLSRVVGAGFAVPGDFDASGRLLRAHAYFPALRDCDVADELGRNMPVPVFVENDGAAASAGERVHGAGRRLQTFVFIHIGHGVGGGLVLEGRLFRGTHGNAGLMGGLYPLDAPRPSGQDLIETLQSKRVRVEDFNDLETLDPDSAPLKAWIRRAARQLELALSVGGRMIDPEAIIIGGRLPPAILGALFDALDVDAAFAPSQSLPRPDVLRSELGPDGGVIGAASLCMFKVFFETQQGRFGSATLVR